MTLLTDSLAISRQIGEMHWWVLEDTFLHSFHTRANIRQSSLVLPLQAWFKKSISATAVFH